MVTNRYLQNYPTETTSEQTLYEDLIVESIEMMGHNIYYIPRNSDNSKVDMLFGEDPLTKFNDFYVVEMYISSTRDFEGDQDFMSKFGLEVRDHMKLLVSARSFYKNIPSAVRTRPSEGDLLWIPVFGRLMEITFVEQEHEFHSLGKRTLYTYEIKCEQFKYSNEEIETGIPEIDVVENENAFSMMAKLEVPPNSLPYLNFINGEIIYQGIDEASATGTAKVSYVDIPNNQIWIDNIRGRFIYGTNNVYYIADETGGNLLLDEHNSPIFAESDVVLKGAQSGAERAVIAMSQFRDDNNPGSYEISDNQIINDEQIGIIDDSEVDPLGSFGGR